MRHIIWEGAASVPLSGAHTAARRPALRHHPKLISETGVGDVQVVTSPTVKA
jgi:hypothetical protein